MDATHIMMFGGGGLQSSLQSAVQQHFQSGFICCLRPSPSCWALPSAKRVHVLASHSFYYYLVAVRLYFCLPNSTHTVRNTTMCLGSRWLCICTHVLLRLHLFFACKVPAFTAAWDCSPGRAILMVFSASEIHGKWMRSCTTWCSWMLHMHMHATAGAILFQAHTL